MVDTNDEQKLAMNEDSEVKLAEMVSSDHGMTMIFMLGDCTEDSICVPYIIL